MKRLLLLLLFAAPAFGQQVIPIQNSSFEQLPIPNPAFQLPNAVETFGTCFNYYFARSGYTNELPPGWHKTFNDPVWGGVQILQPASGNPCSVLAPVDGSWMLYLGKTTVSNELSTKPSDLEPPGVGNINGLYVMTFWVANYFTVYPGYYEASIWFGAIDPVTQIVNGHELCSIDGWATQHFTEITFPCRQPNYLLGEWPGGAPADPNAHLIISLSVQDGWPLLFDNVSLTFTPTN